mgnify:CR=1 FL=1
MRGRKRKERDRIRRNIKERETEMRLGKNFVVKKIFPCFGKGFFFCGRGGREGGR